MEAKSFFAKGYVHMLLTVVLIGAIIALAAYAHLTYKQAQGTYTGATTISVRGTGEVLAKPDIGTFSFSVNAEGADAATAQELSAESINTILAYLAEQGVEDKDIKTEYYNLNPKYRYEERPCAFNSYCPPGEPILDGYEVSQTITVKVRNLDGAGELITGVGEKGATNISSLSFTVDDETVLKSEARAKAIAEGKEKAEQLAKDLDARIVRLVGFYEEDGSYYPMMESSYGMGGDMAYDTKAVSPQMPTGEQSITSTVNLTYEIE